MTVKFHPITPAATHAATAQAIIEHLKANSADLPVADSGAHRYLGIRLEGTGMAIQISDMTHGDYAVFPAIDADPYLVATADVGLGAILRKHDLTSENPEDTAKALRALRLCVMRAAKHAARREVATA